MQSLQTIVNNELLNHWCQHLPECKTFINNFFSSCKDYTQQTNFINYMYDLELESEVNPGRKKYESYLIQAFIDITGSCQDRV
ncbi:hypothetical protein HQ545_02615 [Candidatus Woesearchaeota archaeon]|nr:hypothetical protein [Candidatus Woesearchaeota archaeon]